MPDILRGRGDFLALHALHHFDDGAVGGGIEAEAARIVHYQSMSGQGAIVSESLSDRHVGDAAPVDSRRSAALLPPYSQPVGFENLPEGFDPDNFFSDD